MKKIKSAQRQMIGVIVVLLGILLPLFCLKKWMIAMGILFSVVGCVMLFRGKKSNKMIQRAVRKIQVFILVYSLYNFMRIMEGSLFYISICSSLKFCFFSFGIIFIIVCFLSILLDLQKGMESVLNEMNQKIVSEKIKNLLFVIMWSMIIGMISRFSYALLQSCASVTDRVLGIFFTVEVMSAVVFLVLSIFVVMLIQKSKMLKTLEDHKYREEYVLDRIQNQKRKRKILSLGLGSFSIIFCIAVCGIKYHSYSNYANDTPINLITALSNDDRESLSYYLYKTETKPPKGLIHAADQSVTIDGILFRLKEYVSDGSVLYARFDIQSEEMISFFANHKLSSVEGRWFICNGAGYGDLEYLYPNEKDTALFWQNKVTAYYSFDQMGDLGIGYLQEKDRNKIFVVNQKEYKLLGDQADAFLNNRKNVHDYDMITAKCDCFDCSFETSVFQSDLPGKSMRLSPLSFRYSFKEQEDDSRIQNMILHYSTGKKRVVIQNGYDVDDQISHNGKAFRRIPDDDSISNGFLWTYPQDFANLKSCEVEWDDSQSVILK